MVSNEGITQRFQYDGVGNLASSTDNGNWAFEWDTENRLVRAKTNGVVALECWHDGYGRRVARCDKTKTCKELC
jgi:YD repeat-containing protein